MRPEYTVKCMPNQYANQKLKGSAVATTKVKKSRKKKFDLFDIHCYHLK